MKCCDGPYIIFEAVTEAINKPVTHNCRSMPYTFRKYYSRQFNLHQPHSFFNVQPDPIKKVPTGI